MKVSLRNKYMALNIDRKRMSAHRFIAECWIPNPDGKATINHKNGEKADNAVSNLEWATHSENHKHAYNEGLRPTKAIIMDGVKKYDSIKEASECTGIGTAGICRAAQGVYKTSGGHVWEYGDQS